MQNQTFTEFQKIPVDLIQVSDLNFRKDYDEETLDELKKSLDECGELQPIVVRKKENGKYELIIGSRRLLATKKLGSEEINAIITEGFDDKTIIEMALTENLQRENLTPFEEASAIVRLINDYGMKLKDVAKKIGKSNGFVRNRMQLLSLPEDIQKKISEKNFPLALASSRLLNRQKCEKKSLKLR